MGEHPVPCKEGLGLDGVEAGHRHPAVVECGVERILVDKPATGDVDEMHARAHELEGTGVEQMARAGRERGRHHQVVASGAVPRATGRSRTGKRNGSSRRRRRQPHVEGQRPPSDRLAMPRCRSGRRFARSPPSSAANHRSGGGAPSRADAERQHGGENELRDRHRAAPREQVNTGAEHYRRGAVRRCRVGPRHGGQLGGDEVPARPGGHLPPGRSSPKVAPRRPRPRETTPRSAACPRRAIR